MTDEKYMFVTDCADKKRTGRSAFNRRAHAGRGGGDRVNIATNEDCMAVMRRYPDCYFDLAVVDPPYGGGAHLSAEQDLVDGLTGTRKIARAGGKWAAKYGKKS